MKWMQLLSLLGLLSVALAAHQQSDAKLAKPSHQQLSKAPRLLPLPDIQLDIQHWRTEQGTRVYFVQRTEQPMVDLQVVLAAGSGYDAAQPGIAFLTNELLSQGAGGLSADEIAQQFAALGAEYSYSVDRDKAILSLRSLSDVTQMQKAVSLLDKVLSQPTFDHEAVQRQRAQMLRLLQYQQEQPAKIAAKTFYKSIYRGQPYSHDILGHVSSVRAIHEDEIRAFYQQHYLAKDAVITLVGDLNQAHAHQIADYISQHLNKGPVLPAIPPVRQQAVLSKHVPFEAEQVHIYLGGLGVTYHSPNYLPLMLANKILGGSMDSRLFKAVREQQGLAYSVYSRLLPWMAKGLFFVNLQTRKQDAKRAIALVRQVFANYIKQGPTQSELVNAKNSFIQALPFGLANNASISQLLVTMGFYHLPLDYYQTLPRRVQSVTLKAVQTALQQKFASQSLTLVTVGQLVDGKE